MSDLHVRPIGGTTHGAHRAIDFPLTVVLPQVLPDSLGEDAPAARSFDERRIERAVREILLAVGEDPDREGLRETPTRVARAYREIFAGLRQDPREHLGKQFEHGGDELVMVRDIQFHSVCEHHLLPFSGTASIAYQPGNGKVVGLSKLARTVEVFARRPQIQEQLTAQIADAIEKELGARGVTVVLEAEHLCMKMRGAKSPNASMRTVTHRGVFRDDREARQEVMAALGVTSR